MSLINDALKQARQSQQQNPPSGQTPLRPVASAPRGMADWFLPLAVIALAGAAVFFIALALMKHGQSMPAKMPDVSKKQPAAVAVATNSPAVSNSVAAVAHSPAEMKLQGVIYGNKSWAIVDGKTVYVGDIVAGFRVKEIFPNGITLQGPDGSEQKLTLGGQ